MGWAFPDQLLGLYYSYLLLVWVVADTHNSKTFSKKSVRMIRWEKVHA